jgi:quinol monooxygenase YgiN
MIVRIVKLTFRTEESERFLELYDTWQHKVRASTGCVYLQLLRSTDAPDTFFTYSCWLSPANLDAYRKGEVFGSVWPILKAMFSAPAEAWSVETVSELGSEEKTGP